MVYRGDYYEKIYVLEQKKKYVDIDFLKDVNTGLHMVAVLVDDSGLFAHH